MNTKINAEIREMLLGHNIGLGSCYYGLVHEDFIQEHLKAVNLLAIEGENRLKLKLEQRIDRKITN